MLSERKGRCGLGGTLGISMATTEITDGRYFFIQEKVLELQKQNQNASIVSIIRELIEKDQQEWMKGKKEKRG